MRAVVQRVAQAAVGVAGREVAAIGPGLVVLLGVGQGDGESEARWMAEKLAQLRVFPDEQGLMNRSLVETKGQVLVVSQFTLYGDCRRGRRPSYTEAAPPEEAERLYERVCELLKELGLPVSQGVFRAMMDVALVNQGPVTILLDSRKQF